MSPGRQRTTSHDEHAAASVRHSALAEFQHDERRPAVLLLGALVLAAVFFALGIMLGRWMTDDKDASGHRPPAAVNQPSNLPAAPPERP
ncbi:MAG TPA: hypothetical protein VD835_19450 [Pyrinomonadaceae bacterium]|nr:hypothetical protein [Pyrinomonadaceae bacterium]